MDDTLWKAIKNRPCTVSIHGIKRVKTPFSGDPKICLTATVSFSGTGGQVPMWAIAKGRTDTCERRLRSHSEKAVKDS
jgi:hypothetical protein